ncbi:Bud site selection protein bud4, partial [Elasticomyces elasticus]
MPRPLSELGSTECRRNSPSYNQATRVRLALESLGPFLTFSQKMIVSRESSPFDSSPFTRSPRQFWEGRDPLSPGRFDTENTPDRESSPSAVRRSSIENLKKASRVKNSNMYAREHKQDYDPSSLPIVERPLVSNRPMSAQSTASPFTRFDSLRKENSPLKSPEGRGHRRTESTTQLPILSPGTTPSKVPLPSSPAKELVSPTKSSISNSSRFGAGAQGFDPENGIWSEGEDDEYRVPTPRVIHRQNKSVTFHSEPPIINEYEQQTPEPSSVASGSRQGSYDSEENDDADVSFDRGSSMDQEDSFDASLEDTDKTPVVLPEDWTRMSPEMARTDLVYDEDDVFDERADNTPATPTKSRPSPVRSESVNSDGDARPLPPLPDSSKLKMERRMSAGLAATAERVSSAQRSLPSPPRPASVSKSDILKMRESSLSMDDRLRLMNFGDVAPAVETDMDDNLRAVLALPSPVNKRAKQQEIQVHEDGVEPGTETDDVADLVEYSIPPRISRESILRKVQGRNFDDMEYDEYGSDHSSPSRDYADLARIDPDVPIPSRETSSILDDMGANVDDDFVIKEEHDEDHIDLAAIPTLQYELVSHERSPSRMEDYARESSVIRHTMDQDDVEDDESRYSSPMSERAEAEGDHTRTGSDSENPPHRELTHDDDFSTPPTESKEVEVRQNHMSLPTFSDFLGTDEFDFGLKSYITPSPPPSAEKQRAIEPAKTDRSIELPERASTPVQSTLTLEPLDLPRPSFMEPVELEVGTPESVIHNPITENTPPESPPKETPTIPERSATIKTGGKLKARPSATPTDLQAMAATRRQISGGCPPPVPAKHQAQLSTSSNSENYGLGSLSSEGSLDSDDTKTDSLVESEGKRRESRKMKLDLNIPSTDMGSGLGLGLDKEFDRVIESQKVVLSFPLPPHAQFSAARQASRDQFQQYGGSSFELSPVQQQESSSPTFPTTNCAERIGCTPFSPQQSTNTDSRIRTQKGYLTRQNTKVVVASNRNFSTDSVPGSRATRSAPNSPRKPSSGEKFITTEPWNGQTRRKSVRRESGRQSRVGTGAAPPLPGMESALGVVEETSLLDDEDDGTENGRLFVKVVGVRDLDLPLPKSTPSLMSRNIQSMLTQIADDRTYFQLTLDNGLHCVTTASLELGRSAPVGQEFELVVLNDLEFQLTLTTKLPPPPRAPSPPVSTSPT